MSEGEKRALSYHGMKLIGHMVKALLPLWLFKKILFIYHVIRRVESIPKSMLCRRRVDSTIVRLRTESDPIRFGFYVVIDSMFQWRKVFELMREDGRFSPFIVVIPRVGWGLDDMIKTVDATYNSLVKQYGAEVVFKGYDKGAYNNYIDRCDACAMMSVYHGMSEPMFETEYFGMHGVPIFASSYSYNNGDLASREFFGLDSLRYLRRMYFDNEVELEYYQRSQGRAVRKDSSFISGCPKTDSLSWGARGGGGRKTILVCPHHSVIPSVDNGICVGNFLKHKELLLSLPKRYPEINWIFRPHPHLHLRLTKDVGWKIERWNDYIRQWCANDNAEYETAGSYYDSFARSDAMIQDCCSFLPEYFYTGKPQCYMLDSLAAKRKQFDDWGYELLAHTYQAFTADDILKFIDEVVVGGHDSMRETREMFARTRVMINYPNASKIIINDIAKLLGRGQE